MTTKEKFAQKLGIDVKDFEIPEVSKIEKMEAQVLYSAVMSGTLLEEDATDE